MTRTAAGSGPVLVSASARLNSSSHRLAGGGLRRPPLHIQGVPEMTGGFLVGQRVQRLLAGQPGVPYRFGGGFGADGRGPQEVVGELGVAPPRAFSEHLGDPAVRLRPGLRRELGVEGFPDQRVPEPIHLADVLAGAEQADPGGAIAQPGHGSGRRAQHRRDQAAVSAASSRERPTNASVPCGPAGCGMLATFPNQAPPSPTLAFAQATARSRRLNGPFTAVARLFRYR